jgi:type I restriction enzyme S subunit
MTGTWPTVSLAELLHLERRPVKIESTKLYQEIGIYCFGRGVFRKTARTGLEVGEKDLFLMKEGDFILQVTFAWEGAVALISKGEDGMYGSSRYPTFRVDQSRCSPQFLMDYFKTHEGLQQLVKISPGSSGRNRVLSIKRIPEVMVPLPSLEVQHRVNERFTLISSQIGEALVLRQQAAIDTEALVVSIHKQLAGGRTRKLGQILRMAEDSVPVVGSGSYPQVGVRSFGRGLFPKSATRGMETTYKRFNRLYDVAIVLSQVKGWEGAVAGCPPELAGWFVSPEYRTFQCIPGEGIFGYLAPLLRTEWFWSKLKHATRGVGARRERTRPEQFLDIELVMPDVEQQTRGARLFADVSNLKHYQTETRLEMDALLPSVLSLAFAGGLNNVVR